MDTVQNFPSKSWKNASPELMNLWRNLPAAFLASVNAGTATITSLVLSGAIAGSEVLTYDAKKFYVAMSLMCGMNGTAATVAYNIYWYDAANTLAMALCNTNHYWDATGAAYKAVGNILDLHNIMFSRIATGNYTYYRVNGYKIVIP